MVGLLESVTNWTKEKLGISRQRSTILVVGSVTCLSVISVLSYNIWEDYRLLGMNFNELTEALYDKLKKDVGDSIVLTSGIRSVVKQTHLFLAKTIQSKGNLSKASRSLAPPGHSYHGIGDFDVGKVGFGRKNFTEAFAKTDEFKRLVDLGYVDIRYHRNNMLGVRYEPWHIKVV